MMEAFVRAHDSLKGTEQVRKLAAAEYAAKEFSLKAEQAQREAKIQSEKRAKEEELARQRVITAAAAVGGLLLLVLLGVAVNAYRNKKKANQVIEKQKAEVEHQKLLIEVRNREVHDSITYAKRLQDAILPPVKLWKTYLPESFVLYQPKDIVAGDFYWMEVSSGLILFAVADCTGHGVPGAMVSVVCSNALNRAVKEFGLHEPGRILDKVTELVVETFERSESEVNDGMDISLCCLNPADKTLLWSGANNPLWIARNAELIEVKPDKQPVGHFEGVKPFTTHKFQLQGGDSVYLFSDGFADQFGGGSGKKFKYRQLKEKILALSPLPAEEQKTVLENIFHEWRGNLEQVDDVCLVGFKIN
jgi:serine phosphatase RsbU (regulator of sigma subunit)